MKRKSLLRMAVVNPRAKSRIPGRRRVTNHKIIGEAKEMAYARKLASVKPVVSLVEPVYHLTSHKLRMLVRHAIHAGFRMGRGR